MDKVIKIIREWLEDVKRVHLKRAPVDMDLVMKLTREYIEQKKPSRSKWQMVGVASLITQLQKQELDTLSLEKFSDLCDGACPLEELRKLLKESLFQEYLYAGKKICGYEVKGALGIGSYGTVSLVKVEDGVKALKIITSDPREGLFPLAEIDITSRLRNPYLVHTDKLVLSEEKTCDIKGYGLLLPLGIGDTVSMHRTLEFGDKVVMLYDNLLALRCLHSKNIIHGDLKPGNVIVFREELKTPEEPKVSKGSLAVHQDYEYRLTDFGISRYLDPQTGSFPSNLDLYTSAFCPPEGFQKKPVTFTVASDVWALGATFFNILTGKFVFFDPASESSEDLEEIIFEKVEHYSKTEDQSLYWKNIMDLVTPQIDPKFAENIKDVLERMLDFDPAKRGTVEKLLEHPLFDQLWSLSGISKHVSDYCTASDRTNAEIRERMKTLSTEGDFPPDYELLKYLASYIVTPHSIFLALDLFYQAYPRLMQEKPSGRTRKAYLLTCVGMVVKLGGVKTFLPKGFYLSSEEIQTPELVTIERKIIEHLEGKLVRKSYYNYIRTKNQLQALVKITHSSKDYLESDDFEAWADKQSPEGGSISTLTLPEVLAMFKGK